MFYKAFYVYINTTNNHNCFYTGLTNDLCRRAWEHKNDFNRGFTYRYSVKRLVYYEEYGDFYDAHHRERQIKRYRRQWKINLINKMNPNWEDLYYKICDNEKAPE